MVEKRHTLHYFVAKIRFRDAILEVGRCLVFTNSYACAIFYIRHVYYHHSYKNVGFLLAVYCEFFLNTIQLNIIDSECAIKVLIGTFIGEIHFLEFFWK